MKEVSVYNKRMKLVKGEGAYVWDEEGNRYFDALTGIGVAILGHNNKKLVEQMKDQSKKLVVAGPMFAHNEKEEFFDQIEHYVDYDYAFMSNSGTEAVEAAIKFARHETGREKIISMTNAFHGRTLGSLSATWKKEYKDDFKPLLDGFEHIPFNNTEVAKEEIDEETGAVIMEPIQGQAGMIPAEPDFVQTVKDLCEDHGALLIDDEVQSGMRTGKFLAIQHYGVEPDIVAMGKGLANGVPIGLTLCDFDIPKGKHGSTFGGNPFASKVAAAVLKVIKKEKLIEKITEISINLESEQIIKLRGKGMMKGAIMGDTVDNYMPKLQEAGIIAGVSGNRIIRFLPPINVTEKKISWLERTVEEVIDDVGD